jgi:hypothetical protein
MSEVRGGGCELLLWGIAGTSPEPRGNVLGGADGRVLGRGIEPVDICAGEGRGMGATGSSTCSPMRAVVGALSGTSTPVSHRRFNIIAAIHGATRAAWAIPSNGKPRAAASATRRSSVAASAATRVASSARNTAVAAYACHADGEALLDAMTRPTEACPVMPQSADIVTLHRACRSSPWRSAPRWACGWSLAFHESSDYRWC